jgi:hypothetical protein
MAASFQNSREALPLSAAANAAALAATGRKRNALDPSLLSNQRPGVAGAPIGQQSSIHSQTRSLDSHHHHRYWLPLSDLQ